jgi:hypothetical protein
MFFPNSGAVFNQKSFEIVYKTNPRKNWTFTNSDILESLQWFHCRVLAGVDFKVLYYLLIFYFQIRNQTPYPRQVELFFI